MSNNDYEDDDFDFEDSSSNQSNDLVKQLRKAAKQKDKELAELKAQFESVSKANRERTIKEVLEARGVNGKVAKFIPQDLDPTEESLSQWLEEYGDVFGVQATQSNQSVVDPAQASSYNKMNQAMNNGLTPDSSDDLMKKILNTNTPEELTELLRQQSL